jgi:hypothetical protein
MKYVFKLKIEEKPLNAGKTPERSIQNKISLENSEQI